MVIRVLVVDDNEFVRRSIIIALQQADGIAVIAECADGIAVAEMAERVRPDVVVMDVQMPVMSGIDAAWLLHACQADARVIILSGLLSPRIVAAAAAAGALGFLQKNGDAAALVRAVRAVAAGGTAWPYAMTPTDAPLVVGARG